MSDISVDSIRELRKTNRESCHWGHVGILLDHIDALQAEVAELRSELDLHDEAKCLARDVEIVRLREALEDTVKPHDAYCECTGCRIVYDKESPVQTESGDEK